MLSEDKIQAIAVLMYERSSKKLTKKGLKLARRACRVLNMSTDEMITIEKCLMYRDSNGKLYNLFTGMELKSETD